MNINIRIQKRNNIIQPWLYSLLHNYRVYTRIILNCILCMYRLNFNNNSIKKKTV